MDVRICEREVCDNQHIFWFIYQPLFPLIYNLVTHGPDSGFWGHSDLRVQTNLLTVSLIHVDDESSDPENPIWYQLQH
jgi:hypothetical protein